MRVIRHTPEWLLDRGWRPGNPHRRRITLRRRLVTLTVLAVLLSIIVGYLHLTNPRRVQQLADDYLTELVGGTIEIRSATLSLFEGLRLEGLRINTPDGETVLSASSLQVSYDPARLLRGRLFATRLLATDAVIRVVEMPDEGRWNFQSLRQRLDDREDARAAGGARRSPPLPRLPEVLLRNARVEYAERHGPRTEEIGRLSIEGQLEPVDGDLYRFRLTTRGFSDPIGPTVEGALSRRGDFIEARLPRFQVGPDVQAMLPSKIRAWWRTHGLSGAVRVPRLRLEQRADGTAGFDVAIAVDGVAMTIEPSLWLGTEALAAARDGRRLVESLRSLGLDDRGLLGVASEATEIAPAALRDAAGTFRFSESRIEVDGLVARYHENVLRIDGSIDGYESDAPMQLRVSNSPTQPLHIVESPGYLSSLPPRAREVYHRFRPRGTGDVVVEVRRDHSAAETRVSGRLDIASGQFTFDRFPYPVHDARGRIRFGIDERTGREELVIEGIRGSGIPGTVNAGAVVELSGRISPLDHTSGVEIHVSGRKVESDPALLNALPPRTRRVLRSLDADGTGRLPHFTGGFDCRVVRTPGEAGEWSTSIDVDVNSGEAKIAAFPYPLRDVRVHLRVEDDRIRVSNGRVRRGNAELGVEGTLRFPEADAASPGDGALHADLRLRGESLPVDRELLQALPEQPRELLDRLQLTGTLDFEGRVIADDQADPTYDLTLRLRDGTVRPRDSTFTLRDISATLRLRRDLVLLQELTGRRGDAGVTGTGTVRVEGDKVGFDLELVGKSLSLDDELRSLLPEHARSRWDRLRPEGTVNVSASVARKPDGAATYRVQVDPVRARLAPHDLPFPIEDLSGRVIFTPGRVEFADLGGRSGETKWLLGGNISSDAGGTHELRGAVTALAIDERLLQSLPDTLAKPLRSAAFSGTIDVVVDRWRRVVVDSRQEDEFDLQLATRDARCDLGVTASEVSGRARLRALLRNDSIETLDAQVDVSSAVLAGRPLRDARGVVRRVEGSPVFAVRDLRGSLADGELAGQVDFVPPGEGPGRYAMSLVLRNADLRQLAGIGDGKTDARLTASIALEGRSGDAGSRRGRGDVVVQGRQLYQLPVLLGLFNVTNLSLPISSPFDRGTASYGVSGNRLTIEQLELRAADLRLSGNGSIDFDSRAVSLDFTTDAAWAKLPIIGDFIQGARNELLQLRVRGTLQEPKVGAAAFGTLTTTIDEVMQAPR